MVLSDLAPRLGELPSPFALALVVRRAPQPAEDEREAPIEKRCHRVDAEERSQGQEKGDLLLKGTCVAAEEPLERARDVSDGVSVAVRLAPERPPVALRVEAQHVDEKPVHQPPERERRGLLRRPLDAAAAVFQVFFNGFSHVVLPVWSDTVIIPCPPPGG